MTSYLKIYLIRTALRQHADWCRGQAANATTGAYADLMVKEREECLQLLNAMERDGFEEAMK